MKEKIITFFKGMWIGGTMTVPGVSGGSMAMILGIYGNIINAVGAFTKNIRKNIIFLLCLGIGGLLGILLFSKYIVIPLMEHYPTPTGYFFLGAIVGGIPIIIKTANVTKFNLSVIIYPVIGMIPILLLALMPDGFFAFGEGFGIRECAVQILGGVFVAVAFVLPGISLSQVLLMMGIYEKLMLAVGNLDFKTIFSFTPLFFGIIIGTLLVAKIMNIAIEKFPQKTYLTVFGFLLASVPELIFSIGFPVGTEIPICILTALSGFAFIYFLQKS